MSKLLCGCDSRSPGAGYCKRCTKKAVIASWKIIREEKRHKIAATIDEYNKRVESYNCCEMIDREVYIKAESKRLRFLLSEIEKEYSSLLLTKKPHK